MKKETTIEKRIAVIEGFCVELHKYLDEKEKNPVTEKQPQRILETRLAEFGTHKEAWEDAEKQKKKGWVASDIVVEKDAFFQSVVVKYQRPVVFKL